MPDIRSIDPLQPQSAVIDAAAGIIRNGGVVILPTHGLYGLGGDAFSQAAVYRIFDIKGRPREKPLLVLVSNRRMISRLVPSICPMASHFMDRFWPGRLTLVMEGRKDLPEGLCSGEGKLGVRLVGHRVAAALVEAVGGPITGTSANLAGSGAFAGIDVIDSEVKASVDMILDAGVLGGGPGSTVVDATGTLPVILRSGAIPAQEIMEAFEAFAASRVDKEG